MSRAEQGALVIYTRGNTAFQQLIQHQEISTIKSGYDDNHIKSYAISAKNLLDEMNEGSELLPQANRKKLSEPIDTNSVVEPGVIVAEDTSDTVEIINGTWTNSSLVKDITYKSEKYATDGTKVGKYIAKNKIQLLENDPVIETILSIYN